VSEGPLDASGNPLRCSICNTPVQVVSMTAGGARYACECRRTSWLRLAGGELRLATEAEREADEPEGAA
jgi:hypothetical protein